MSSILGTKSTSVVHPFCEYTREGNPQAASGAYLIVSAADITLKIDPFPFTVSGIGEFSYTGLGSNYCYVRVSYTVGLTPGEPSASNFYVKTWINTPLTLFGQMEMGHPAGHQVIHSGTGIFRVGAGEKFYIGCGHVSLTTQYMSSANFPSHISIEVLYDSQYA